ncbi:Tetratricopeptide repeat-containing protein [Lentibacillus halodurans]|uniref:Tetratricopeptide repeat-containing protein n=1 Tax=Lentibacillus halodurans TaxID=237679 RepID=A0A1I1ASV6_9BACI|nr:tetratricopeptide repeat protein [Lentibacillus halodurans]SFB39403.1 Tetratricopeptide repeat-containing protein [Lentibacillus halodurans]
MENSQEKVILFPKWRMALEKESLLALKEKKYEEALEKLDQLLGFGVQNHEIIIGKLMCLMELNRYKEAQDFCEALLIHKDEHYYHYVHIYLTILFQTSQYELLMNQVVLEFNAKTIPDDMKEQFQQLYDMSSKMQQEIRIEKTPAYINDLFKAVAEENHAYQYTLVEQIRKMDIDPAERLQSLLADDRVHPVTKTAIFIWLQEKGISEKVLIHKLGAELIIAPDSVSKLSSHPVMKQALLIINEHEQENPTLFQFMEQLLNHYLYVKYPIMPKEDDISFVAAALTKISEDYLDIHTKKRAAEDEHVTQYMEEIKMCEALYSTIIEV